MKRTIEQKGITLVALIITIVILLILASVAISSIQDNGIISKAQYAAYITKVKNYEEELMLYISEQQLNNMFNYNASTLFASKTTEPSITDIIKSMDDEDAEKFNISGGKLVYIGSDSQEREWNGNTGVQVGYEIKKIYGNSIQNGTPSPTTPVEIQSVGDKTINLLNKSNFTLYGTVRKYIDIFLEAGTYYYTSNLHSESGVVFWTGIINNDTYDIEAPIKTFSAFAGTQDKGSFNISEANNYRFLIYCSDQNRFNSLENVWDNIWIQIEEGTVATAYEPYGYRIPVKSSGKNLLDFSNMKLINTTDTAVRGGWIFEFNEDIDITISYGGTETLPTAILLAKKVTDGVYGSNIQLTTNTKTISLKKNEKLLVFVGSEKVDKSYKMLADYGVTWIQIEKGNTATEYEPYVEPQIHNIYLDEPLRKINDYADYIDFEKKQVVRQIKEVTISSFGEGLQKLSDVNGYYRYETTGRVSDKLFTEQKSENILCTALSVITYSEHANNTIAERTNLNYLRILTSDYATVEELNQAIGNEKVYYVLAEESPSNIELPNIPTHKGTTILSVDTQIQPSKIEK